MSDWEITDLIDPAPTPRIIPRREFKPWHRPRKQLVRREQWRAQFFDLLSEIREMAEASQTINYLGLPGEDFLDVRIFHDVIQELDLQRRMRFLAFDESASTENLDNLPRSILYDLPLLVPERSHIVNHSLTTMANANSPAQQRLREFHTGFDVVNLDLCKGIKPPRGAGILDALTVILSHQLNCRTAPWLFFLTMRTDTPSIDPHVLAKFASLIEENCQLSEQFRSGIESLHVCSSRLGSLKSLPTLSEQDRVSVPSSTPQEVGLGVGKWIIQLLHMHGVEFAPQQCLMYSVGSDAPNMASLSFKIRKEPVILSDRSGLLSVPNGSAPRYPDSEQIAALRLIAPISKMQNIDSLLLRNPGLHEEMIKESALLLQRAGYDEERYREWVAKSQ